MKIDPRDRLLTLALIVAAFALAEAAIVTLLFGSR